MFKKYIKIPYVFKVNEKYCFLNYTENEVYYDNVFKEYTRIKKSIVNYTIENFEIEGSKISLFIKENELENEIANGFDIFILDNSQLMADLFDCEK